VAADDVGVYWTDDEKHTVGFAPHEGGEPVVRAEGQVAAAWIAVDEMSVYWLTPTALMAMTK
jgi:hypothetical protein